MNESKYIDVVFSTQYKKFKPLTDARRYVEKLLDGEL